MKIPKLEALLLLLGILIGWGSLIGMCVKQQEQLKISQRDAALLHAKLYQTEQDRDFVVREYRDMEVQHLRMSMLLDEVRKQRDSAFRLLARQRNSAAHAPYTCNSRCIITNADLSRKQ